jgi:hypothetical protein
MMPQIYSICEEANKKNQCAFHRFAIRSSQYVPYILTAREESDPQNTYGNNPPEG